MRVVLCHAHEDPEGRIPADASVELANSTDSRLIHEGRAVAEPDKVLLLALPAPGYPGRAEVCPGGMPLAEGAIALASPGTAQDLQEKGLAVVLPRSARPDAQLTPPHAEGESLSAYVRRVIVGDEVIAAFRTMRERWRAGAPDLSLRRPASLTRERAEAFHRDLSSVDAAHLPRREHWAFLDGLHKADRKRSPRLPFTLPAPKRVPQIRPSFEQNRRWVIARQRARRRDMLAAALFDALRQGTIEARGFLSPDEHRTKIPIQQGWWNDWSMICRWRVNELRADQGAAPGTPTFRGIRLYPVAEPGPGRPPGLERAASSEQPIEACVECLNSLVAQNPTFRLTALEQETACRKGLITKNWRQARALWKNALPEGSPWRKTGARKHR